MTTKKPPAKEVPEVVYDDKGKPYKKGRFLGKGGFARCYELYDKQRNITFAGKIVSKDLLKGSNQKEKMAQEITIHRDLCHPHVVRLDGYFEDPDNIYILLELCPRRSLMELHKRRGALTPPEARYMTLQIAEGIEYLHARAIIHRDLKLGNVFLNDEMMQVFWVKIGDFGLATTMEKGDDRKKTLCGTPNYIAPEVLEKTGHAFEVDVWALGCILYTLLVGTPPFETKSLQETYRRIKSNQYRIPSTIGNTAAKVIRELLAANPASRPKIAEVKKYAYFAEYTPTHLPTSCLTLPPKFSKTMDATPKRVPSPSRALTSQKANVEQFYKDGSKDSDQRDVKPQIVQMSSDCYAQELFNKLRATLLKGGTRNISPIEDLAEAPECMPVFWVSKWVDYSDKYGIGYQLCDNSVGVLYNDNSRLVLDAAGLNLQYVERDNYEEYFMMNKDLERMKHLEKKTTLLKFFRDYMNQHLLKAGEKFAPKEGDELARLPCLRSWFRTGSAIVLHLTNGTLQINFFNDHTKLILCPHLGAVTFIDREKKLRTFKLELLETHGFDVDLRSRLKYAEGMIERLMAKTNGTTKSEVSSTSGQVAWSSGVSSLKAKPQSSQI